jgi:hypothetical protein
LGFPKLACLLVSLRLNARKALLASLLFRKHLQSSFLGFHLAIVCVRKFLSAYHWHYLPLFIVFIVASFFCRAAFLAASAFLVEAGAFGAGTLKAGTGLFTGAGTPGSLGETPRPTCAGFGGTGFGFCIFVPI